MALLTSSEIYAHLRVSGSPPDDAAIIQVYERAAYDYLASLLNTSNYPKCPALKAAALLVIGDLYESRQANVAGVTIQANPAVMNLAHPYRKELGI